MTQYRIEYLYQGANEYGVATFVTSKSRAESYCRLLRICNPKVVETRVTEVEDRREEKKRRKKEERLATPR